MSSANPSSELKRILSLLPGLINLNEEIKKFEKKIGEAKVSYKENFQKAVDEIIVVMSKYQKNSEIFNEFLSFNIGTAIDYYSFDEKLFLSIENYTSVNSPIKLVYIAHCLVGSLFSNDPTFCYIRLKKENSDEISLILKNIAKELGIAIEFFNKKEKLDGIEWDSINLILSKIIN